MSSATYPLPMGKSVNELSMRIPQACGMQWCAQVLHRLDRSAHSCGSGVFLSRECVSGHRYHVLRVRVVTAGFVCNATLPICLAVGGYDRGSVHMYSAVHLN